MGEKKLYLRNIKFNGIPGATPNAVTAANAAAQPVTPAQVNQTAKAVKQITKVAVAQPAT